ncbi:hypothetical protein ADL05_13295 [Nocardiopsis sp. NRRL B-16309]|nr:hypothetical protein ADL05_13295 [Nocardiopsis sp. NRRL B-16309]
MRPKALWYGISAALALACVLAIGLAVFLANNPIRATPEVVAEIRPRETVELEVGEGEAEAWAVYSTPGGRPADCEFISPAGEYRLLSPDQRHDGESHGEWIFLGVLDTPEPGTYEVHCSGAGHSGEVREGVDYVVGGADVIHSVNAQRNTVPTIVIITALAGLGAAVLLAVVTAVRRGVARKRARSDRAMVQHP